MSKYREELKEQKQIIEDMGYKVAYICLYGSQNYGLDINNDDYQSDIDMKAVIVPTLKDLINNSKPVSTVIETEWGQCDLKDIRTYFDKGILKANPVYIETLYTEHYIVDELFEEEFRFIRFERDELVSTLKYQMLRAMYGMMCEKRKALCHPYPTIKDKIEKYGYDGKQLHHIYRIYIMILKYFELHLPYSECLWKFDEFDHTLLMDYKLNKLSLEDALFDTNRIMNHAEHMRNYFLEKSDENKIDYSIRDYFRELSKKIIENKIIDEIRRMNI